MTLKYITSFLSNISQCTNEVFEEKEYISVPIRVLRYFYWNTVSNKSTGVKFHSTHPHLSPYIQGLPRLFPSSSLQLTHTPSFCFLSYYFMISNSYILVNRNVLLPFSISPFSFKKYFKITQKTTEAKLFVERWIQSLSEPFLFYCGLIVPIVIQSGFHS